MSDLALGVSVAGVAEAVRSLQQVGDATRGVTAATGSHAEAVRLAVREGQIYNFHEQRRAEATAAATNATNGASLASIQFGQRLAGVANAVQALVGQMGGGSHAAGLIGATANSAVQFSQLGAALGPQGALVGGIVGAAIPILHELASAFDDTALRATHAGDTVEQMVARYEGMQAAASLADRLAHGTATQEERLTAATRAQAIYSQSVADGVDLQNQLDAALRSDSTTLERVASQAIPGVGAAMDALHASRQREIERLRESITQSDAHTEALRREADAATDLANVPGVMNPLTESELQDQRDAAMGGRLKHGPDRGRGGGTSREERADQSLAGLRAQIDQLESGPLAGIEEATQTLEDMFTTAWNAAATGAASYGDALTSVIAQLRETQEAQAEQAREVAAADAAEAQSAQELANLKAHFRETEARELADATSLRHKTLEQQVADEQAAKNKIAQAQHERTSQTQAATGQMIGALTDVFTLIGEGQATAAQGAELLLASFLQYISQRATIEALAQVAQAIGSYPDPAGMALHAAAAVAWGAVAVATGVGANALQSDVQGQMNAAHPGAATKDTASASNEREASRDSGPLIFNIYPGGFITKADVDAGVVAALDRADRNGVRPRFARAA